ncbi:UPF0223 family protein [Alkalicoccus chagannorensis]|uniref:UPF0223 family protein n=1 Tax=Alkalicoccus chagannorensis TaxID=427072 RepID=UPI0004298F85|nr:UPF0223 family protein [Alkalicoccus chagannorensis]
MSKDVYFPISMDWSKEEVVHVVQFFEGVDQVYNKGMERETFLTLYRHFKEVVPSKAEEKQHFKEYEEQTGQSAYHAVKAAREADPGTKIKK